MPDVAANKTASLTKPQVIGQFGSGDRELNPTEGYLSSSAALRRLTQQRILQIRKHPTVRLMLRTFIGALSQTGWTYKADEALESSTAKSLVEWLRIEIEPHRMNIIRNGIMGFAEWGWAPWEKVLDLDSASLKYTIKKLKPLIQEPTSILVDEEHGEFLGIKQESTEFSRDRILLCSFDVDGTDYRGNSIYWSADVAVKMWDTVNDAAARYDKKMAGAVWRLDYPIGETLYNGVMTPNHTIADQLLSAVRSSGNIAVPQQVQDSLEKLDQEVGQALWNLQLIEAGAKTTFDSRLTYADKLIVRAFGFPERAVLEGEFGTKAEAEAHGDFAIDSLEFMHWTLCDQLNADLIAQLVRLNYGESYVNKITVVPNPLSDTQRALLLNLYNKFLTNPDLLLEESEEVDRQEIRARLQVPTASEQDIDGTLVGPVEDEVDDVQSTALNGAQIASLVELTVQVQTGAMPKESAAGIIRAAFPTLTKRQVDAILAPLHES